MNYKIHAGSNTELIQQRLFDYGYEWHSTPRGKILKAPYLYIDSKNQTIQFDTELKDYLSYDDRELSLNSFFKMFPEKVKVISDSDKLKDLAICQMSTLNAVLSGSGMDIDTAICELSLNNQECFDLAKSEGLDWIAEKIKRNL